jgi:riboflavin kinase/FMN adenylyltransferase
MRIAKAPAELPSREPGDLTMTLGNFDGLHRGHRAVMAETIASSRGRGSLSTAVTFDPHPAGVVDPALAPLLLTPTDEKVALLSETGIDVTLVVDFTREVAGRTAREFLQWLGVGNGSHLVLGYDFHMGKNRECGLAGLSEIGSELGYGLDIVPPVIHAGSPISSSRVRHCIEAGDVEEAGVMLGRPYFLHGTVVAGEAMGGQLGYPTANLATPARKLLPADGVYFATVESLRGAPALLYVGSRPTFERGTRAAEVHVMDFEGDLYGSELAVAVRRRLRGDRRFRSAEELSHQMDRDLAAARKVAGSCGEAAGDTEH